MQPPAKPWTVLVWMAGDNDLEDYALQDLDEIKRVGTGTGLTVVAEVDLMSDRVTRRYVLRPDTRLCDDVVAELGETNTGDPAVAADFFVWGIGAFPSEHVMAVIWNHGTGIDDTDVYLFSTVGDRAAADRGIAYDDTSRDFLDNAELKRVLLDVTRRAGRRIDVLGFDACMMNMVEVAYQLRAPVRFIAGSEQVEPGSGWPYDRVLSAMAARPAMSPRDVGAAVVREYVASHAGRDVTQSLLDVDRVARCADAVDALAATLFAVMDDHAEYGALTRAFSRALRFEIGDFADLGSLCEEIGTALSAPDARHAAASVLDAIAGRDGLVAAVAHTGRENGRARGVSIYAPCHHPARTYAGLDFARQTRWNELLKAIW